MAELNLKQIVDKLNTEFSGDTRKQQQFGYSSPTPTLEKFVISMFGTGNSG